MGLAQGGISSVDTVALLPIETCRPRQRPGLLSSQPHWLQPLPGLTVSLYHSITVASFLATGDSSLEKEVIAHCLQDRDASRLLRACARDHPARPMGGI